MMDIESFVSMLLKSMRKTGLPIAEVEQLHENKWLFGIEMSDKSEFLLKIGKRDAECGIVKYLTKRHLNVNPSVKRWEMTGNPDKSRVVANLNGKK